MAAVTEDPIRLLFSGMLRSLLITTSEGNDALAIRVTYGAAVLTFTLDIAYAVVGPYLVGVTNTGVAVTESELSGLMEIAIA